jgi:hypothetical protein
MQKSTSLSCLFFIKWDQGFCIYTSVLHCVGSFGKGLSDLAQSINLGTEIKLEASNPLVVFLNQAGPERMILLLV